MASRRSLCRWMPSLGARLALALVVGGCATTAPPLPAGFTPQQARIVAGGTPPEAVVEGPASKIGGMFRGAAWGGGIGLLIGAVEVAGCTGFLCGLAIYGDTLLGTLSGAGVGALAADHEAEVDANRAMLAAALVRRPWSAQLAESLRDGQAAEGADARRWTVTVSFAGVDALSHLQDHAFALRLRARWQVQGAGVPGEAGERSFEAISREAWTGEGWRADQGAAVLRALEEGVQTLAAQMRTAMQPGEPAGGGGSRKGGDGS